MKPPFFRYPCARCGSTVHIDAYGNQVGVHLCVPAAVDDLNDVARQVQDGTIADSPIFIDGDFNPDSYENRIRRSKGKGRQDPSVSPGGGGVARQRLFPKPGVPHYRIRWSDYFGRYLFLPLNQEARDLDYQQTGIEPL